MSNLSSSTAGFPSRRAAICASNLPEPSSLSSQASPSRKLSMAAAIAPRCAPSAASVRIENLRHLRDRLAAALQVLAGPRTPYSPNKLNSIVSSFKKPAWELLQADSGRRGDPADVVHLLWNVAHWDWAAIAALRDGSTPGSGTDTKTAVPSGMVTEKDSLRFLLEMCLGRVKAALGKVRRGEDEEEAADGREHETPSELRRASRSSRGSCSSASSSSPSVSSSASSRTSVSSVSVRSLSVGLSSWPGVAEGKEEKAKGTAVGAAPAH